MGLVVVILVTYRDLATVARDDSFESRTLPPLVPRLTALLSGGVVEGVLLTVIRHVLVITSAVTIAWLSVSAGHCDKTWYCNQSNVSNVYVLPRYRSMA